MVWIVEKCLEFFDGTVKSKRIKPHQFSILLSGRKKICSFKLSQKKILRSQLVATSLGASNTFFSEYATADFQELLPGARKTSQVKCGSGSRRENECGSMRIRIHSPALLRIYLPVKGLDMKILGFKLQGS